MGTQVLKIAELAPSNRKLELAGVSYDVSEMTVANFIETMKQAKELEGVKDAAVQVEGSIALVKRFVPQAPEDVLRRLSIEQLGMVIAYVQGDLTVDAEGNPVLAGEKLESSEGGEAKKQAQ